MTSKKRKDLSLKDRVAVIEKYETAKSLRKVADEFGVSAQQIQRILKQKDEIRARYVSNNNPSRKRLRTGHFDLESQLVAWIKSMRGRNAEISGPLIIEKAKELAQTCEDPPLEFSVGWLDRFKSRHNIRFTKLHGEARDG